MSSCGGFSGLFMASRISGFGDIHQGPSDRRLRLARGYNFLLFIQWLMSAIPVQGRAAGRAISQGISDRNPGIKGQPGTGGRLFIAGGAP
jgi:hypothetical protein